MTEIANRLNVLPQTMLVILNGSSCLGWQLLAIRGLSGRIKRLENVWKIWKFSKNFNLKLDFSFLGSYRSALGHPKYGIQSLDGQRVNFPCRNRRWCRSTAPPTAPPAHRHTDNEWQIKTAEYADHFWLAAVIRSGLSVNSFSRLQSLECFLALGAPEGSQRRIGVKKKIH